MCFQTELYTVMILLFMFLVCPSCFQSSNRIPPSIGPPVPTKLVYLSLLSLVSLLEFSWCLWSCACLLCGVLFFEFLSWTYNKPRDNLHVSLNLHLGTQWSLTYTTMVIVIICAVNITWRICNKHDILQYLLSLWSRWILKTDRWWRKSKYCLMGKTFPQTINNKLKVLSVSGTAVLHGW